MDLHAEKEENNSQESASAADQRQETAAAVGEDTSEESMDQREETAAAVGEDTSEESMDQPDEEGHKADESTGLLVLERDVVGSEEASAPPFAHPWSLLRALAGCLGLLGCCGDQKPPPAAATAAATEAAKATAAALAARSSQEEEACGENAKLANAPPQGFYIQEVISRVRVVEVRTRPPDHAREGSGGHGGAHH